MQDLLHSAKENLTFLVLCMAIFAVIVLLAAIAQKFQQTRRSISSTRFITLTAICAAIASVLMLLEIPLFFAPSFYELDLSEIPVMFCGFFLGPVAGVVCELLKILLKLCMKGTSTAFVGDFANFFIGCAMVLPATILYHMRKSKRSAIWGLVIGSIVMTIFGSLFNAIYLIPKFSQLYGVPLDAIVAMGAAINPGIHSVSTLVLFAVVPFNILKSVIVSVVTFLLYKRVEGALFRKFQI